MAFFSYRFRLVGGADTIIGPTTILPNRASYWPLLLLLFARHHWAHFDVHNCFKQVVALGLLVGDIGVLMHAENLWNVGVGE